MCADYESEAANGGVVQNEIRNNLNWLFLKGDNSEKRNCPNWSISNSMADGNIAGCKRALSICWVIYVV